MTSETADLASPANLGTGADLGTEAHLGEAAHIATPVGTEAHLATPGLVTEAAANLVQGNVGGRRILYAPHRCFACGELNEHGLHMALHIQDERCWSELILDERFQGWERIAHGGILATVLDEVMAWSLISRDSWGVTARLNVTFHKPVEVGRRIRADGRVVEHRRRVSRTAATVVDAQTGELLASAEGVYVAASEERRAELKARYRFRLVPEDGRAAAKPGVDGRAAAEPGADGADAEAADTAAGSRQPQADRATASRSGPCRGQRSR